MSRLNYPTHRNPITSMAVIIACPKHEIRLISANTKVSEGDLEKEGGKGKGIKEESSSVVYKCPPPRMAANCFATFTTSNNNFKSNILASMFTCVPPPLLEGGPGGRSEDKGTISL